MLVGSLIVSDGIDIHEATVSFMVPQFRSFPIVRSDDQELPQAFAFIVLYREDGDPDVVDVTLTLTLPDGRPAFVDRRALELFPLDVPTLYVINHEIAPRTEGRGWLEISWSQGAHRVPVLYEHAPSAVE